MATPSAQTPVQDPKYPGVQYLGDWGATHPWHPVDSSTVKTPMDFVSQVDAMGEWASAQDKARAVEIRKAPGSFIVTNGIVQPKPSWLARNGPKIALFAVGAIATAGIANAAMAPAAAANTGIGLGGPAGYGAITPAMAAAAPTAASIVPPVVSTGTSILNKVGKGLGKLSARDWLDAAIFGGNTAAGIWGANKAADASAEAAKIQADAYREGLDFLKTQWAKYNEDFAPYLKAGQGAMGRMNTAMDGTTPPPMPAAVRERVGAPGSLGAFGQPTSSVPTLPRSAATTPGQPPVSTTMPVPRTTQQPVPDTGNGQVMPDGFVGPRIDNGAVDAPMTTADPTLNWPIDPATGLKRPPAAATPPAPTAAPNLSTVTVKVQFPDGTVEPTPVTQLGASLARGGKVIR